jgi:hypothetical protein
MSRLRFTLAQLMAVVLYFGFGFAALRNADDFWASATFTLAISAISVAFVAAFARRGKARTTWSGFAVFGLAYLIIGLWPPLHVINSLYDSYSAGQRPTPILLFDWGLHRLQPFLKPVPPGRAGFIPYDQVSHSLGVILFGLVGAVLGRLVALKGDRPVNLSNFTRIARPSM